jgi:hypothetical protein
MVTPPYIKLQKMVYFKYVTICLKWGRILILNVRKEIRQRTWHLVHKILNSSNYLYPPVNFK